MKIKNKTGWEIWKKKKKVTFSNLLHMAIPTTSLNCKLRILYTWLRCRSTLLVTLSELRLTTHSPLASYTFFSVCALPVSECSKIFNMSDTECKPK